MWYYMEEYMILNKTLLINMYLKKEYCYNIDNKSYDLLYTTATKEDRFTRDYYDIMYTDVFTDVPIDIKVITTIRLTYTQLTIVNYQLKFMKLPALVNNKVWIFRCNNSPYPRSGPLKEGYTSIQTTFLHRLFLCEGSLNFCKYVKLNKHIKHLSNSHTLIQYIKWYNLLQPYEQEATLLRSGSISTFLGIRKSNDVDISTCLQHIKQRTPTNVDCTWIRDTNISDIETILDISWFHQNHKHFYFLGIKCMSVSGWLLSKTIRNRPKQYAELLYMKNRLPYILKDHDVTIPPKPKYRVWYKGSKGRTYYTDTEYEWVVSTYPYAHPKLDRYFHDRVEFNGSVFNKRINIILKQLSEN